MRDVRKNDDREVFTPEELPEDLLDELEAKIEEARSLGVVETDFEIVHILTNVVPDVPPDEGDEPR